MSIKYIGSLEELDNAIKLGARLQELYAFLHNFYISRIPRLMGANYSYSKSLTMDIARDERKAMIEQTRVSAENFMKQAEDLSGQYKDSKVVQKYLVVMKRFCDGILEETEKEKVKEVLNKMK